MNYSNILLTLFSWLSFFMYMYFQKFKVTENNYGNFFTVLSGHSRELWKECWSQIGRERGVWWLRLQLSRLLIRVRRYLLLNCTHSTKTPRNVISNIILLTSRLLLNITSQNEFGSRLFGPESWVPGGRSLIKKLRWLAPPHSTELLVVFVDVFLLRIKL